MTETSVGRGPTGVDEAFLLVRASVTRTPADDHATPIVAAKMMALTVSSPGNNVDDMGRAYGCIAATSPQASTMSSAGGFDSGRSTSRQLPAWGGMKKYPAHEAQQFRDQGARQPYAAVEVRELREPCPSQPAL